MIGTQNAYGQAPEEDATPWRKFCDVPEEDMPCIMSRGAGYREDMTLTQFAEAVGLPQS
jgi:hypothetical protein